MIYIFLNNYKVIFYLDLILWKFFEYDVILSVKRMLDFFKIVLEDVFLILCREENFKNKEWIFRRGLNICVFLFG